MFNAGMCHCGVDVNQLFHGLNYYKELFGFSLFVCIEVKRHPNTNTP